MALSGHSPPPYVVAGSPPRSINGSMSTLGERGCALTDTQRSGHLEQHYPPSMYRHSQPMPPPSPQQFGARYHPIPPSSAAPPPPHPPSQFDMKAPHQIPPPPAPPPAMPSIHKRPGSSMSISSMLGESPERVPESHFHVSRPPRSGSFAAPMSVGGIMSPLQSSHTRGGAQTPDRFGSRARGASMGTALSFNRPVIEQQERLTRPPAMSFPIPSPFSGLSTFSTEQDERARRTSLSGILQRPSSQPQQPLPMSESQPPERHTWYADPPRPQLEPPRINGLTSTYDTRPPGFRDVPRAGSTTQSTPAPHSQSQSISPELRRVTSATYNRGLAGILNGPPGPSMDAQGVTHAMARQASTQSQSSHTHKNDFRHYSPFNANFNNSHGIATSIEDQTRKGSDEVAHKAIIGLGLDGRRGRFSPVPQAVQGAQAQTPVPEGIKSEQGRVFSGIGGGMGSTSTGVTPTPHVESPLKRDVSMTKNGVEAVRARPSNGKRSRRPQDDAVDESTDSRKGVATTKVNKRTKYQNNYKADLEDMTTQATPRRGTPLSNSAAARNFSNPMAGLSSVRHDRVPYRPYKKVVKTAQIMAQVLKQPRRHLGTYTYNPQVLVPEEPAATGGLNSDSDIMIKPNLLPAFDCPSQVNGTIHVRVPHMWLADRERRLVCQTRNVWGTGIYTDDSDPVAAAIHMGWLRPSFSSGVDDALLSRIVKDQNPKVEVAKEFKPPSTPMEMCKGQDLRIELVVMPQLESYSGTARFGFSSRSWSENEGNAVHDGVSFAVLGCEFVKAGLEERRTGRTGTEKRARLRAQMEARVRAAKNERERLAKLLEKRKRRKKEEEEEKKRSQNERGDVEEEPSVEDNFDSELTQVRESTVLIGDGPGVAASSTTTTTTVPVSAGQDWIGQLATAAA